MNVGELFFKLGFDLDDSGFEKYNKTIGKAVDNLGKITAAAAAVVIAMDKIVDSTVRGTTALENFNAQTGLSIDKLQKFQISAQLNNIGLSTEDITNSIQTLQSNLAAIRIGQGNIAPFQIMGVDALGQDAFSVIDQLREKIKGVDDMTATNLISQMGLNPQFITVLKMSKEEFAGLNKEIMLTAKQREAIMKVGIEVRKLQLLFEAMLNKTIAKMEPVLIQIVQSFENIVYAIQKLHLQIPFLILGLAGVLRFFKVLNVETARWTLGLAALLFFLDDFAAWSRGGKSLFDYSGMMKFFDELGKQIEKLGKLTEKYPALFELAKILGNTLLGAIGGYAIAGAPGAFIGAAAGGGGTVGIDANAYIQDKLPTITLPDFNPKTHNLPAVNKNINTNSTTSKTINQNNTINVQSHAADANDVGRAVIQQTDSAILDTNNGGF